MSDFISDDWCAGCGNCIVHASRTGVSGLYYPNQKAILLCTPCFDEEDDLIERMGTNNIPDRLNKYLQRLREKGELDEKAQE